MSSLNKNVLDNKEYKITFNNRSSEIFYIIKKTPILQTHVLFKYKVYFSILKLQTHRWCPNLVLHLSSFNRPFSFEVSSFQRGIVMVFLIKRKWYKLEIFRRIRIFNKTRRSENRHENNNTVGPIKIFWISVIYTRLRCHGNRGK